MAGSAHVGFFREVCGVGSALMQTVGVRDGYRAMASAVSSISILYPRFSLIATGGVVLVSSVPMVELRFFGGLSVEETAEALKVSPRTVMSDWSLAKAWLLRELSGERSNETGTHEA